MKNIIPGHRYELSWFETFSKHSQIPPNVEGSPIIVTTDQTFFVGPQVIQFIQKEPVEGAPTGTLQTIFNGTTNEEVLEVLIDRLQFLNNKFPCRENSIVLTHLETALLWLNKRTADRKLRSVEGKALA